MDSIHDLLELALKARASDLIVKAGSPPVLRVDGAIATADAPVMNTQQAERIVHSIEIASQRERLFQPDAELSEEEIFELALGDGAENAEDRSIADNERDFVFTIPGLARIRANVYRQNASSAAAIRIIPLQPLTLEELEMPSALQDLALQSRGLILVTGPTGSGKSTTLAAMIEHINRSARRNVITIEDPIEFVFQERQSIIQQREVGRDTSSFAAALTAALRQTPDVLMVGEMRTTEAMEAALMAAEVGHLVLSTLHTTSAPASIDRLLNSFPPERRPQVTSQITATLTGIVAQRLVPRADRPGLIAATEIMAPSPTVLKLIEEGNTGDLIAAIREGSHYGMTTFNQSLERLQRQGKISSDVALNSSNNPQELRQLLRHA
jgi:twitching motility protein PilT